MSRRVRVCLNTTRMHICKNSFLPAEPLFSIQSYLMLSSKSTSIFYLPRTEEGKLNLTDASVQAHITARTTIIQKKHEAAAPLKLAQMLITMYRSMVLYESDFHTSSAGPKCHPDCLAGEDGGFLCISWKEKPPNPHLIRAPWVHIKEILLPTQRVTSSQPSVCVQTSPLVHFGRLGICS